MTLDLVIRTARLPGAATHPTVDIGVRGRAKAITLESMARELK